MKHFETSSKVAQKCGQFGIKIVTPGFRKSLKQQKIAQYGHTEKNSILGQNKIIEACLDFHYKLLQRKWL